MAPATGRQEPFHAEFGRGLQVQIDAPGEHRPLVVGQERLQCRIGTGATAGEWRLDLEHAGIGKIVPQLGQHRGPGTQCLQVRARSPIGVRQALTRP